MPDSKVEFGRIDDISFPRQTLLLVKNKMTNKLPLLSKDHKIPNVSRPRGNCRCMEILY